MTPKVGVARVTCPTFEAMGQIPAFHRTYFVLERISLKVYTMFSSSNFRLKVFTERLSHHTVQMADCSILRADRQWQSVVVWSMSVFLVAA